MRTHLLIPSPSPFPSGCSTPFLHLRPGVFHMAPAKSPSTQKIEKGCTVRNRPKINDVYCKIKDAKFRTETVSVEIQNKKQLGIDLRLTRDNIVTGCNPEFETLLDLGDQIEAINGIEVMNRNELRKEMLKITLANRKETSYTLSITRRRLERVFPIPPNHPHIPPTEERPDGISFYKAILAFWADSALGLNVKTVDARVYVVGVDNGWRSVSRRCFHVGDILLAVGNGKKTQPAGSVAHLREIIKKEIQKDNYAEVIFARASTLTAVRNIRHALTFDKKKENEDINPRMADDVTDICIKEIERMQHDSLSFESILRKDGKKVDVNSHVEYEPKCRVLQICIEPSINPLYLMPTPPRGSSSKGKPEPPTPKPVPSTPSPGSSKENSKESTDGPPSASPNKQSAEMEKETAELGKQLEESGAMSPNTKCSLREKGTGKTPKGIDKIEKTLDEKTEDKTEDRTTTEEDRVIPKKGGKIGGKVKKPRVKKTK